MDLWEEGKINFQPSCDGSSFVALLFNYNFIVHILKPLKCRCHSTICVHACVWHVECACLHVCDSDFFCFKLSIQSVMFNIKFTSKIRFKVQLIATIAYLNWLFFVHLLAENESTACDFLKITIPYYLQINDSFHFHIFVYLCLWFWLDVFAQCVCVCGVLSAFIRSCPYFCMNPHIHPHIRQCDAAKIWVQTSFKHAV